MNKKRKSRINDAVAWVVIILCTLLCGVVYFSDGFIKGDDMVFHLGQIYDVYYEMTKGFWGLGPNHLAYGALAYNTYAFYGPLSHHMAAFFMYLFYPIGVDALVAVKLTSVLTIFISGIFAYYLGKNMTHSYVGGLVFGVAYVFHPYRIFCSLCRGAFPEAIAMGFIPMVFYGVYGVVNSPKFRFMPYIALIIGIPCVFLSHPYTGLMTIIFALLYLIFNIKKLIKIIMNWKRALVAVASCVMIVGFVSYYVFPLMSGMSSNLYRVSDPIAMWTNVPYIQATVSRSYTYSGLLNFGAIDYYVSNGTWDPINNTDAISLSFAFYGLGAMLTIVFDQILALKGKSVKTRLVLDFLLFFLVGNMVYQSFEFTGAMFVFFAVFAIYQINGGRAGIEALEEDKPIKIFKDPDLYYSVVSLFILSVLLFNVDIWAYVPAFMLKAQFAWRLWSLFYTMVLFLAAVIQRYMKKVPVVNPVLLGGAAVLVACCQAIPEKRYATTMNPDSFYYQYDYEETRDQSMLGWQNEYTPWCFYKSDYIPSYENSLYYTVRNMILYRGDKPHTIEEYVSPVFLVGEGTIEITSLNTPDVSFHAVVTSEDAFVQILQLYYKGYEIKLTDKDGNKSETPCVYTDGLISFNLDQGEYDIDIKYVGTKSYRAGILFMAASMVGLFGLCAAGFYSFVRRERYEIDFKPLQAG